MLRWQLCQAIEEAGGLLPVNWLWLEQPLAAYPADVALVLGPGCGTPDELAQQLKGRSLRLLTQPGTPRQRCQSPPWPPPPAGTEWLLLAGQPAGPNRWEERPLYGQRIALTRESTQAEPLRLRLQELGAQVVLCPVLQFLAPDQPEPLQIALRDLESYRWVIFTSPNGVRTFMQALGQHGDVRRLGAAKLAAIGPGTAGALTEWGLRADLVPAQSVAEGLLKAFQDHPVEGLRILLPRAQEARPILPDELRRRGALVDVVPCYKTVMPEPPPQLEEVDRVVLMSSSAARHFRQLCNTNPECVCIGPVTAQTARELGFTRLIQARQFDQEGVLQALLS
jgi:uroporphyrinogen III methyltransferase/synthase